MIVIVITVATNIVIMTVTHKVIIVGYFFGSRVSSGVNIVLIIEVRRLLLRRLERLEILT